MRQVAIPVYRMEVRRGREGRAGVPELILYPHLECAASSECVAKLCRAGWRVLPLLAALLLVSVRANAFDPARCDNDRDPVPGFALGRDANGCLQIADGLGNTVLFDYEAHDADSTKFILPSHAGGSGDCTSAQDCSLVIWNVTFDDYTRTTSSALHGKCDAGANKGSKCTLPTGSQCPGSYCSAPPDGQDALNFAGRYKNLLWRNVAFGNTWKCQGGSWTMPGGNAICEPAHTSRGHVDALQLRSQPGNGGWSVWQDSKFLNSQNQHLLMEKHEAVNGFGGIAFQNVYGGYEAGWGAAVDWIKDTRDMGHPKLPKGYFQVGSNQSANPAIGSWLINSRSVIPIDPNHTKVLVVVNGGMGGPCSNEDKFPGPCNGKKIGYTNGWPAPLGHFAAARRRTDKGPDVEGCPNGRIDADVHGDGTVTVPVYCFTSLDAAKAATHNASTCPDCPLTFPPFLQLSNTGWLDTDGDSVPDFKDK